MLNILKKSFLLFVAILVVTTAVPVTAVDWNHDPASDIGPYNWGNLDPSFATCGTGTQQSPVDIVGALPGQLPVLNLDYLDTPLDIENNGHTIEVPYELGSTMRFDGDVYRLLQFHFHVPSEHAVNGQVFDMEAHLVHISSTGQLAVVGVLMTVGDNPNPLVDLIMANAPLTLGTVPVEGVEVNAKGLLPPAGVHADNITDYYAYPGSLTTPPCSEGVRWFVLQDTVEVSAQAVARLHEIISDFPTYFGYPNNNRPVQPLNERVIIDRQRL